MFFYTLFCFHSCHLLCGWVWVYRSSPLRQDCTVHACFPADVPHCHSSSFRTSCFFQVPPLSSPLFSFCSLVLSKLQHSSLLPFHLSVLSTVSVYPEEGKNISEPTNVRNFLMELSAPLPDGSFGIKVVEMAAGFRLFIYCYKNPGKQMSFISSKVLKHERIWSATAYILYPNKKTVSVELGCLVFRSRMKNNHFEWLSKIKTTTYRTFLTHVIYNYFVAKIYHFIIKISNI